MRALIQRVTRARVTLRDGGELLGEIGPGLLVLVCALPGDTAVIAGQLAAKIAKLRIFEDYNGKMNLSLKDLGKDVGDDVGDDVGGAALAVSQFTLAADTRKGNRPSFTGAAPPEEAEARYQDFCAALAGEGIAVERGRFGAAMEVELVNDGPVTIWLESPAAG